MPLCFITPGLALLSPPFAEELQESGAQMLLATLLHLTPIGASTGTTCPNGMTLVDTFHVDEARWTACEDLQQPGGSIALISSASGQTEWFNKGHSMYGSSPTGNDDDYYLNYTKRQAVGARADVLALGLLSSEITWQRVADAVPPLRMVGVRTFVGSRGSVADTSFSDGGEDAAGYGFPPALSYVFNLTNMAQGGKPIVEPAQYLNSSAMADGLVGDFLPIVVFYYPVVANSPYLPASLTRGGRRLYWTMLASPSPETNGSREQPVWFRFQQVACASSMGSCELVGWPQYWDTYWWSRVPGANTTSPAAGPSAAASAGGFYKSLLANRKWWAAELQAEGMMALRLPAGTQTNGTQLATQMTHNLIRSMITWHNKWGPRYGVLPGYGIAMQNGFEDVFTATAMAALEVGAMAYARGLIDHQWRHIIRYDGMIRYRAEEVAQQAQMLTILALYHSYADSEVTVSSSSLLLEHFDKAKALAEWLLARRAESLTHGPADPRYGIPAGVDEGDDFKVQYLHKMGYQSHWYASAAAAYRAFAELGRVWVQVGKAAARPDVAAHGAKLLQMAPLLYRDLHTSLNRTVNTTTSPGHRCYPHRADGVGTYPGCNFRSYPEMFFSGALTAEQTDAMYTAGLGVTTCEIGRWLTVGSPSGGGSGAALVFAHIPQGLPFGLLVHDMVERFLLYFFTQAAHSATRGTYNTPESTHIDRNSRGWPYASPGQANVPMALKWMLCFEEPETRTLWLAKATPREWLESGQAAPIVASNLTTRYGRVSFELKSDDATGSSYIVRASVRLPASFAASPPAGGLRLRLRVPLSMAGKLSSVSVGGQPWRRFSASEETIDFLASELTKEMMATGLRAIVATYE